MAGSGPVGVLLVELQTNLAAFQKDMNKAAASVEGTVGKIQKSLNTLQGGVAAIGAGLFFKKMIDEAAGAESAAKKVDAVLRATGGSAGITAKAVDNLATSLSKMSGIDDDIIKDAEAMLLTFNKVGKQAFPQAMKAALDMSAVLGTDLKSATLQIGKALQDPIRGIGSLHKLGVSFTAGQQALIKSFVDGGQAAKAQGVILDALKMKYDGAAAAARDTLGGALGALQTAIDNLFEGIGKNLGGENGLRIFLESAIEGVQLLTQYAPGIARVFEGIAAGASVLIGVKLGAELAAVGVQIVKLIRFANPWVLGLTAAAFAFTALRDVQLTWLGSTKTVSQVLGELTAQIGSYLIPALNMIYAAVRAAADVFGVFLSASVPVLQVLGNTLAKVAMDVVEFFTVIIPKGLMSFPAAFNIVVDRLQSSGKSIFDWLAGLLKGFTDFYGQLLTGVNQALSIVGDVIQTFVKNILPIVAPGLAAVLNALGEFAAAAGNAVGGAAAEGGKQMQANMKAAAAGITNVMNNVGQNIGKALNPATETVNNGIKVMQKSLDAFMNKFRGYAKENIVGNMVKDADKFLKEMMAKIGAAKGPMTGAGAGADEGMTEAHQKDLDKLAEITKELNGQLEILRAKGELNATSIAQAEAELKIKALTNLNDAERNAAAKELAGIISSIHRQEELNQVKAMTDEMRAQLDIARAQLNAGGQMSAELEAELKLRKMLFLTDDDRLKAQTELAKLIAETRQAADLKTVQDVTKELHSQNEIAKEVVSDNWEIAAAMQAQAKISKLTNLDAEQRKKALADITAELREQKNIEGVKRANTIVDDLKAELAALKDKRDGLTELRKETAALDEVTKKLALTEAQRADYKKVLEGLTAEIKKQKDAIENQNKVIESITSSTASLAAKQRELSQALHDGKINSEQYEDAMKKLGDQYQKSRQKAEDFFKTTLSGFADALVSGKSFKEILSDLSKQMLKLAAQKLLIDPLAKKLASMFTPGAPGVGGAAGGGLLSKIGGLFGGGQTAPLTVPSPGIAGGGLLTNPLTAGISGGGAGGGIVDMFKRFFGGSSGGASKTGPASGVPSISLSASGGGAGNNITVPDVSPILRDMMRAFTNSSGGAWKVFVVGGADDLGKIKSTSEALLKVFDNPLKMSNPFFPNLLRAIDDFLTLKALFDTFFKKNDVSEVVDAIAGGAQQTVKELQASTTKLIGAIDNSNDPATDNKDESILGAMRDAADRLRQISNDLKDYFNNTLAYLDKLNDGTAWRVTFDKAAPVEPKFGEPLPVLGAPLMPVNPLALGGPSTMGAGGLLGDAAFNKRFFGGTEGGPTSSGQFGGAGSSAAISVTGGGGGGIESLAKKFDDIMAELRKLMTGTGGGAWKVFAVNCGCGTDFKNSFSDMKASLDEQTAGFAALALLIAAALGTGGAEGATTQPGKDPRKLITNRQEAIQANQADTRNRIQNFRSTYGDATDPNSNIDPMWRSNQEAAMMAQGQQAQTALNQSANFMGYNRQTDPAGGGFLDYGSGGGFNFGGGGGGGFMDMGLPEAMPQISTRVPGVSAAGGNYGGIGYATPQHTPQSQLGPYSGADQYAKSGWQNYGNGEVGAVARALGGPVNDGQRYMVGERGPEMFLPDVAGQIVPNNMLGGGTNVNVHNNTSTPIEASNVSSDGNNTEIMLNNVMSSSAQTPSFNRAIRSQFNVQNKGNRRG